jgi:hypothetical protein
MVPDQMAVVGLSSVGIESIGDILRHVCRAPVAASQGCRHGGGRDSRFFNPGKHP